MNNTDTILASPETDYGLPVTDIEHYSVVGSAVTAVALSLEEVLSSATLDHLFAGSTV